MWRKINNSNDINAEGTNQNQMIKSHGEKVFNTLKQAISTIENIDNLAQQLNQMGYDHYKYGTRLVRYFKYLLFFVIVF